MDLKDKIKLIRKSKGLTQPKLGELLSIPLNTVKNYERGESTVSTVYLMALLGVFPEYALWLTTNEIAPEAGQISPDQEMPKMSSAGVPVSIVDEAFDKTIETSVMLGWLTPKEGIEFSMLADLHRHNFVEAGGVLLSQDSAQDESKTG